jgi:NRPS condensation-like uncharacterized protein
MRQRIVKYFGSYYWQLIPAEEFERQVDSYFTEITQKLDSDQAIADYLMAELQVRDDYSTPQWRVFFREEHTPGTSLLVLKMHHCISDGYGVVSFLNAISDKPQDLFS